jgi:hypothetical protein
MYPLQINNPGYPKPGQFSFSWRSGLPSSAYWIGIAIDSGHQAVIAVLFRALIVLNVFFCFAAFVLLFFAGILLPPFK